MVQGAAQTMGFGIKLASVLDLPFASCVILNYLVNISNSQPPNLRGKKEGGKAIVYDIIHKVLNCLCIIRFCYGSFDDYDGETLKYFKQ